LGEAGAIFHTHAKDTGIDPHNSAVNGNLDVKSYGDLARRAWGFRTRGYRPRDGVWKPFVSMLRPPRDGGGRSGEHEDSYMSLPEGLRKAAAYLQGVLIREPTGQAWWF